MIHDRDTQYVSRVVHEAEIDRYSRDLNQAAEQTWWRTRSPIYLSACGRCWHADPECIRRRATTPIQVRDSCHHCHFALGNPDAMLPDMS